MYRVIPGLKAVVALEGIETGFEPMAFPVKGAGLKAVVALEGIETWNTNMLSGYCDICLKAVVALEGIETSSMTSPTTYNTQMSQSSSSPGRD